MPTDRVRRSVQGQGGSTLIELLVAMPIALVLLGLVVSALGNAGRQQRDIEHRTEAQTNAQLGLERLTGEVRQADWVYFRSSAVIDMQVPVRDVPTGSATPHLVRWDCSSDVCMRYEGGPTAYPPPAAPVFTDRSTEIGSPRAEQGARYGLITGHDIFFPSVIDPATGRVTENALVPPEYLRIKMRLEVKGRGEFFTLEDGVNLRNLTGYSDD